MKKSQFAQNMFLFQDKDEDGPIKEAKNHNFWLLCINSIITCKYLLPLFKLSSDNVKIDFLNELKA